MDILYILGKGSKHNNIELRWAMRSVEKYGRNIDRVFVVGEDPGFLSDEVIYIPCEDRFGKCKHKNMLYKIQYAVLNSDISDTFLVSSDDIFVLQPFDADTLPMYYSGMLPEFVEKNIKKDSYKYQLYNTRNFLVAHNIPTYKFAMHCIHKMCRKFFEDHRSIIMDAFRDECGVEPNCLVCNCMIREYDSKIREDNKLIGSEKEEDVTTRIRSKWAEFSIGDSALNEYGIDGMNRLYDKKSKWEK